MAKDRSRRRKPTQQADDAARNESGEPGGGKGRRDEVGPTGVYPMSGGIPEGKHLEIRTPAAWGQGERGAEGYNDAGGSELVWRDGVLLGGLTAGPSGEPTIDIHGGDIPPNAPGASGRAAGDEREGREQRAAGGQREEREQRAGGAQREDREQRGDERGRGSPREGRRDPGRDDEGR